MADTNNNPAAATTGGPSVSSTGPNAAQNLPDSQKGDAANPTGAKVPEDNQAHIPGTEDIPPKG